MRIQSVEPQPSSSSVIVNLPSLALHILAGLNPPNIKHTLFEVSIGVNRRHPPWLFGVCFM